MFLDPHKQSIRNGSCTYYPEAVKPPEKQHKSRYANTARYAQLTWKTSPTGYTTTTPTSLGLNASVRITITHLREHTTSCRRIPPRLSTNCRIITTIMNALVVILEPTTGNKKPRPRRSLTARLHAFILLRS